MSDWPDFHLTHAPALPAKHGIERAAWELRFHERIATALGLSIAAAKDTAEAELESWPDEGADPEWLFELPENAADENLSNWSE